MLSLPAAGLQHDGIFSSSVWSINGGILKEITIGIIPFYILRSTVN